MASAVYHAAEHAGYGTLNPDKQIMYLIGRRVIIKYERQIGDHRDIMGDLGFGPTWITYQLMRAIETCTDPRARATLLGHALKAQGMSKDVVEQQTGTKFVLESPQDEKKGKKKPQDGNILSFKKGQS